MLFDEHFEQENHGNVAFIARFHGVITILHLFSFKSLVISFSFLKKSWAVRLFHYQIKSNWIKIFWFGLIQLEHIFYSVPVADLAIQCFNRFGIKPIECSALLFITSIITLERWCEEVQPEREATTKSPV